MGGKEYYQRNREQNQQYQKTYRIKNKEKIKKRDRERYNRLGGNLYQNKTLILKELKEYLNNSPNKDIYKKVFQI